MLTYPRALFDAAIKPDSDGERSLLRNHISQGQAGCRYLYLPRDPGEKSQRTEKAGNGLLIDYGKDGQPIGIEITAPDLVSADVLNEILARLNIRPVEPIEVSPLLAA